MRSYPRCCTVRVTAVCSSLLTFFAAAAAPPDGCTAVRADSPPALDGRLDDVTWQKAASCGDFTVYGGQGRRTDTTAFRVAYDDAWLYVGVDCRNPHMNALQPLVRGHDNGACNDDSAEVFLDPGTGGRMYFHYMLNFANAKDERRIRGTHRDLLWDVPWRSATEVREDGWSAEIALPLYILASYGSPAAFRLNVTRNRRIPVIDAQNVVVEEQRELSSWSPVLKSFHEPEIFRPLTGIVELKLRTPLLVNIADVQVSPYYLEGGQSFFGLDVQLKGYNQQRGQLELVVTDTPVSGTPRETARTASMQGTAVQKLTIAVPVQTPCAREVTVRLRDAQRHEVLATRVVEDLSALNVMTAYLDRNYYTKEERGYALCRIGLPPAVLRGMLLEVRTPGGEPLGGPVSATAAGKIPFALTALPPGTSTVTAALTQKDGAVFFEVELEVTRRAPKPGLEWKIDRERQVVLNNGKPFFPFGMVMSGVKPEDEYAFRELVDNNFDTFLVWTKTTPEGLAEFQQQAAKHGLFVISHPDECTQNIEWECTSRYSGELLQKVKRATQRQSLISLKSVLTLPIPISERNAIYGEFYDKNIERCLHGVDLVKEFRNLAGYFILDEPMSAQHFDQYRFGQDYYARVHRTDGYHPVVVNYSSHIPEGDQYVNWCDILMTDPYWSPPAAESTRSTPNHVSKVCWLTRRRALAHRQAVWKVLVGPLWSGCRKRPLNHRELRCQTYLAVIHKATGIFYFAYSWVRPAVWATFKGLGAEMKTLSPFALGPEVPQTLTCRRAVLSHPGAEPTFTDTPFDPPKEQYPDVQAALFADGQGQHMLLAANVRHYPVACRFELPGLTGVTAEFGEGSPVAGRAAFTDTLEPYATRAYRVRLQAHDGEIPLTVSITVLQADVPNPETMLPFACRTDGKNLLPNPSLEDEHTAGWPDYCLVSSGVATDNEEALFGDKSVKFENTGRNRYEVLHMHCAPQSDKPLTYTFSLHMKGAADGLKAWIRATQLNPEKTYAECESVKLTTSWQRYSLTGIMPAKVDDGSSMFEIRLMEPGTMWIDGLQLERSAEATGYEQ